MDGISNGVIFNDLESTGFQGHSIFQSRLSQKQQVLGKSYYRTLIGNALCWTVPLLMTCIITLQKNVTKLDWPNYISNIASCGLSASPELLVYSLCIRIYVYWCIRLFIKHCLLCTCFHSRWWVICTGYFRWSCRCWPRWPFCGSG